MLSKFFYNLLVGVSYLVPGHYVWVAIALITILLRAIFIKSSISMAKMQLKQRKMQVKIDEIKTTHKEDKQKQQQALMELYKQEKFNPLSSCLPLIVQIVVFIAFYRVFAGGANITEVNVGMLYPFIHNHGALNSSFFGIDLAKSVSALVKQGGVSVLCYAFPLVAGLTQLYQSLQMRSTQPKPGTGGEGEGLQRALNTQMTYLFPAMTAYISFTLPAALSIYWITQTVFMIFQQIYINKKYINNPEYNVAQLGKPERKVFSKSGVVVEVREKKNKADLN